MDIMAAPTLFEKCDPKFPAVQDDRHIPTEQFLLASQQILPIFDIMGAAFKPVKADISGNITKLTLKFNKDRKRFCTLNDMLHEEVENRTTRTKGSATIALLWFKRGMQFIICLMRQIIADHHAGVHQESMSPYIKQSYEEALKRYHSWVIQKIFSVVSRAVPHKQDFLRTCAGGQEGMENKVISDMEVFVDELAANIDLIQDLYTELDLDFNEKA